jgi:hypothetical protein
VSAGNEHIESAGRKKEKRSFHMMKPISLTNMLGSFMTVALLLTTIATQLSPEMRKMDEEQITNLQKAIADMNKADSKSTLNAADMVT